MRVAASGGKPENFYGVQALRGLAACLVVLNHASMGWSAMAAGNLSRTFLNGGSGVDIFFTISGFVMATSSQGKGSGPRAAWRFFERRVVRVLPLYWLFTTLLLLKIESSQSHSGGQRIVSLHYALCSYLLIPCRNLTGQTLPLLAPGWTLSFEMFFYLCFALVLWRWRNVLPVLTAVLTGLTLLGSLHHFRAPLFSLLSPLLLEFIAGLWLGHLVRSRFVQKQSRMLLAAVGVAALLVLLAVPQLPWGQWGRLPWAFAAAALLCTTVALEPALRRLLPRWSLLVGDASYSIYLTHLPLLGLGMFVLSRASRLLPGAGLLGSETGTTLCLLALSVAVGTGAYLLIERPMNNGLRHLLGLRRPFKAAPPLQEALAA